MSSIRVSISWSTEATCSPPRRRASHSAGSHSEGSSPREVGEVMGRGTLGVAARQVRVEREGTRGRRRGGGLLGEERTAEAGESAGARRRIAMDLLGEEEGGGSQRCLVTAQHIGKTTTLMFH
uniref:Uncharacterized protein n=1 Tax=Arundo donax TaxID=35708 RepID=A0A0A9EJ13_ARUDO